MTLISSKKNNGDIKIDSACTFEAFLFDQHQWMLGISPYRRFLNANLNSSAYKKESAHLFIIVLNIFTKRSLGEI